MIEIREGDIVSIVNKDGCGAYEDSVPPLDGVYRIKERCDATVPSGLPCWRIDSLSDSEFVNKHTYGAELTLLQRPA